MKRVGNQFTAITIAFSLTIMIFILPQISCSLMNKLFNDQDNVTNSMIVLDDTPLYAALDDTFTEEIMEFETPVRKTGKCKSSETKDGEVYCPIQAVYSSKKGWVAEEMLIDFLDYLPGENQFPNNSNLVNQN
jgi:hypothetical protein